MALGGKTVQYTLAVNMETGQLTAESRRVAVELGLIKKQTSETDLSMRDLSSGIKGVKQALSLISGAAVFGLISSQMGQLVGFAQQFHGRTKDAADEMERLGKFIKTSVGESGIFASIMEGVAWLSKAVVLGKAGGFGAAGQLEKQIAAIQTEREKKAAEEIKKINEQILEIEKAVNSEKRQSLSIDSELRDLAWERSRLFKDEILPDVEPLMDANLDIARIAMEQHSEILVSQKEALNDSIEALDNTYSYKSEQFRENDIAATEAWINEKLTLQQIFVQGMSDGFASIGAAVVNGQNAFKSFGAVFLKTIAQLAIQFGTFLILVGVGMSAVSSLFGMSGAAAIAAGTALTIFGGALGALASKAGGGGSGSRGSEREQRFRDSRFNTSGSGGTTINNYINFQNTIGLTRDAMKEVGEAVSKEIFKQTKLGRIETVPA